MQTPIGASLAQYHAALESRVRPTTTVRLLTAEHEPVAEVTAQTLPSAQVNFPGAGAEVSRTLQLSLLDPTAALQLDSDSPNDGAVYADRFIQVVQTIESPLLSKPASVTVFTGPLVKFSRNGEVVTVEAQGKEQRARTDVPSLVCKRGMFVVDAIEKIMRQRCGEQLFAFPKGVRDRLPDDVTVGRVAEKWPWRVCLQLAASIGMQLFYDGRGVLVLRDIPTRPLLELVPTRPMTVEHDWTQVFNRVEVKGKKNVHAVAVAERHPFAPGPMGRNGVEWERSVFIENTKIGTKAQARKVAERELGRVLTQGLKVTGSAVPVWHLDPGDLVSVYGEPFRLDDASIPVTGGDMTLGETVNVRRPTR